MSHLSDVAGIMAFFTFSMVITCLAVLWSISCNRPEPVLDIESTANRLRNSIQQPGSFIAVIPPTLIERIEVLRGLLMRNTDVPNLRHEFSSGFRASLNQSLNRCIETRKGTLHVENITNARQQDVRYFGTADRAAPAGLTSTW